MGKRRPTDILSGAENIQYNYCPVGDLLACSSAHKTTASVSAAREHQHTCLSFIFFIFFIKSIIFAVAGVTCDKSMSD